MNHTYLVSMPTLIQIGKNQGEDCGIREVATMMSANPVSRNATGRLPNIDCGHRLAHQNRISPSAATGRKNRTGICVAAKPKVPAITRMPRHFGRKLMRPRVRVTVSHSPGWGKKQPYPNPNAPTRATLPAGVWAKLTKRGKVSIGGMTRSLDLGRVLSGTRTATAAALIAPLLPRIVPESDF